MSAISTRYSQKLARTNPSPALPLTQSLFGKSTLTAAVTAAAAAAMISEITAVAMLRLLPVSVPPSAFFSE